MPSTQIDIHAAALLSLGAFVVWLACGLTIALGRPAFGVETTLRLHAIAAPIFAALVSLAFFARFRAVPPLAAAAFVTAFIIVLDAALVAPVFEKSYAMFGSILGTWLPFLLIFAATYLTGAWVVGHSRQIPAGPAGDVHR